MEDVAYKIAYVKLATSDEMFMFLCEDITIEVGDFVLVEGQNLPVQIVKLELLKEDTLNCPIDTLPRVIKKTNQISNNTPMTDLNKEEEEASPSGIDGIKICVDIDFEFSYADYHTDYLMKVKDDTYVTAYSLIKSLSVINHTNQAYANMAIKIEFSNENFKMDDITIRKIDAFEELVLRIPFLKVKKQYMEDLLEQESVSVKFDLVNQLTAALIQTEVYSFNILPISQPSRHIRDDERLYAKFVTPSAPRVKQIALDAIRFNQERSILAYQNQGENRYNAMLEEAQSIYLALHNWGIAYQNPPTGGLFTQRIRLPEEVLKDKKGTCLDLALLFCACLEEVGFHSILIIIDGHAFAGFFLHEKAGFSNAIEYQCGKVFNLASGGMHQIFLVECTMYTVFNDASFQQAIEQGMNQIKLYEGKRFAAIDIHRAHQGIFSPIPTQGSDDDLELLIRPKEIKDKTLDSIIEAKFIDVSREIEKDRFSVWERKLLDLTEANPLVNFKLKASNCMKLTSDCSLYDLLLKKEAIKFVCLQMETAHNATQSIENEFIKGNLRPSDVFGKEFDKEKLLAIGFEKTLKNLIKKSNMAMDETGAPTLYLCLGVLTYNRKKDMGKGHAPFLVLPIKITKDKGGPYYTISYDMDDIMVNQTFFEYYTQEHPTVDFRGLYHINANDRYLDIVHTFKVNNTEDIQLDEASFFIANLTFAHYIMWQDVRKRKEELKKNQIIQSILANQNVLSEQVSDLNQSVDAVEKYSNFAAPLAYDSTQLKAILECGEGKSFILDGPPGTGKSQTIVNMIVNAFYHGKTILFVAEKKAALDVVANRLRKLGDPDSENNLGRFCLELHSNKANKSEFFGKLKSSMELGVTKNPEEFEQKCLELEQRRDKILSSIQKMHEKKYVYSLYDAIVQYETLRNFAYMVDFDESYLLTLTEDLRKKTYDLIDSYIAIASHFNDFNTNPLKVLKVDNINYYDCQNVIHEFEFAKETFLDFIKSYKELLSHFSMNFAFEHDTIATIMDIFDLCFHHDLYVNTLSEFMNQPTDEVSQFVFDTSKAFLKQKDKMQLIYHLDALGEVDAKTALDELANRKGFFQKIKVKKKWKKILKSLLQPTHKYNKKNLVKYYHSIAQYNSLYSTIKDNCGIVSKMTGLDYLRQIEQVATIEENYRHTRTFFHLLQLLSKEKSFIEISSLFIHLYETKNPIVSMLYAICENKFKQYKEVEKELTNHYKIDYTYYQSMGQSVEQWMDVLEYATNEHHQAEFVDISKINQISKELEQVGLHLFVDALVESKFDYNDFKEVYDLSCANGYIKLYFKDEDINYFNPESFDVEVKKYKQLIHTYNNLVVSCVSARLTKQLNHSNMNYANSSPIGRLKKTISSNGRGVSIRETLLQYDEIIKTYFPCFLMSPLSAAQYLSVDESSGKVVSKFDLVIFDEASQIPTHEAIGPIARGKSLIVAGDPEQMPPSAYFTAGLELAEDEVQFEDAISLLDECLAIELPRIRLSYHYRSKHESLIHFSNHHFYNDNLYTFPSSYTTNSLISFHHIDLKEDKKNSNITKEEIDAICKQFQSIYTNEETKHKSVGIIVFNMKQQEKVFDAITELLANHKALNQIVEEAVEQTKEPWFVKSLENVQGDERDIILLSVGFRKNAAGRAIVIGPLARENGQRRLNVAVSRSKEKMIVLSTIRYTDFEEDSIIKNKGQLMLKQFLKLAEENTFEVCGGSELEKGTILSFIKRDLEERGMKVASNVGSSAFRVDLAIMNQAKNRYELGILIDSSTLGQDISCRDKFYVQESVLNSLKWKIIHIYALEYFKDRKGTIDKIIDAVDDPYIKEEYTLDATIEKADVPIFQYNSCTYQKVQTRIRVMYDNDYGFDSRLQNILFEIIAQESPIAFETIKQRIREFSNIQSMSQKAKAKLQTALRPYNANATQDQTQVVYWKAGDTKEMMQFRIGSNRDLNDIPKEEILCAMKQILTVQGRVSKEDLFRCTLEAFGYGQAVLNKKNQERLEYVYNWAKRYEKIN